jgi:hypothetical protein
MNFATDKQRRVFTRAGFMDSILTRDEVEALFPGADARLERVGWWPTQPVYALDDNGTLLVLFWHRQKEEDVFLYYDDTLKSWGLT